MKKYLEIIKMTFEEFFVYRLSFLFWRLRSFIFFLTLFFFWLAVYQGKGKLFGYQKPQMFSYLIGVAFLKGIVLGSRSIDEAVSGIRSGRIINWLLKPIDIFKGFFIRDLAAKSLDFIFCLLEISLIVFFFRFPFYLPDNIWLILFFIFASSVSVFLYFYLLLFLASFAFWTDRVWSIRWLFLVIFLNLLSGAIFPLDVFPSWFLKIAQLTPFPYLIYFPLKIWLGQLNAFDTFKTLLVMFFWLLAFKKITKVFWQRGLKKYAVYGG